MTRPQLRDRDLPHLRPGFDARARGVGRLAARARGSAHAGRRADTTRQGGDVLMTSPLFV